MIFKAVSRLKKRIMGDNLQSLGEKDFIGGVMRKIYEFVKANWLSYLLVVVLIASVGIVKIRFLDMVDMIAIIPTIFIAIFTGLYWKESRRQAKETRDLAMLQFVKSIYDMKRIELEHSESSPDGEEDFVKLSKFIERMIHNIFKGKKKEWDDVFDAMLGEAKKEIKQNGIPEKKK